jgi:hypothetical protein
MDIDLDRPHSLTYRRVTPLWPRRLLHIPSLKSCERSGTCTYDTTNSPKYAILTYTWGRFEAAPGSPALPVKGVTWRIPPVKDEVFSVASFRRVIEEIGKRHQWLWLDVACIDQENESVKMDEVARQVGIFHMAQEAFVWLHGLQTAHAADCVAFLTKFWAYDPLPEDHIWSYETDTNRLTMSVDYYKTHIINLQSTLEALFKDPWFDSLWTLQESILRRDAQLLSATGEPILFQDQEELVNRICTIKKLTECCEGIWSALHYYASCNGLGSWHQHIASMIMSTIESVGFNVMAAVNPNVQYGAARHRKTHEPRDRIAAIFGIYSTVLPANFRLPSPKSTTLEAQELVFASALNESSPWIAQCFVHLDVPRTGQSWCITQDSTVPAGFDTVHSGWNMEILGRLVPPTTTNPALAQGHACPLQALWNYWKAMRATYETSMPKDLSAPYTFSIAYDKWVFKEYEAWYPSIRAQSGPIVEAIDRPSQDTYEEFKITQQLLNDYPPERLYVLHLAVSRRPPSRHDEPEYQRSFPKIWHGGKADRMDEGFEESGKTWGLQWEMTSIYDGDVKALGVVLLCDEEGVWRRIGICTWIDLPHEGHGLRDWSCEMH